MIVGELATPSPALPNNAHLPISSATRTWISACSRPVASKVQTAAVGARGLPPRGVRRASRSSAKRTSSSMPTSTASRSTPRLRLSDPWKPVIRTGAPVAGVKTVDLAAGRRGRSTPSGRIYGRSASDDKGPIVAMLAALDALKAAGDPALGQPASSSSKERREQGSPHSDPDPHPLQGPPGSRRLILCDGPVHPTRKMQSTSARAASPA